MLKFLKASLACAVLILISLLGMSDRAWSEGPSVSAADLFELQQMAEKIFWLEEEMERRRFLAAELDGGLARRLESAKTTVASMRKLLPVKFGTKLAMFEMEILAVQGELAILRSELEILSELDPLKKLYTERRRVVGSDSQLILERIKTLEYQAHLVREIEKTNGPFTELPVLGCWLSGVVAESFYLSKLGVLGGKEAYRVISLLAAAPLPIGTCWGVFTYYTRKREALVGELLASRRSQKLRDYYGH